MKTFQGTVNSVYPALIKSILRDGAAVPSRNGLTKELHPCVLEILTPRDRLVTSHGRPVNVAFALAEVLWILAGRRDVEMLKFYNKRIDTWSDDGATFNAPYGYRLREAHGHDQLADVIRTLQHDPGSRQAVLNVWHPTSDRGWEIDRTENGWAERGPVWKQHKTADRACNMLSHLMIRDGALDWMHIVRSNDAIWGVPYNFMQWMHLQEYVAEHVGVPVGKFFHMVDSMHIYAQMVPYTDHPGVPDTARWDEALEINQFDLYSITGCHHEPMGRLGAEQIGWLMEVEERIRTKDLKWPDLQTLLLHLPVSNYWKNVLEILYAHKMYLKAMDSSALAVLLGNPDQVMALAQVRFYMAMRWNKDPATQSVVEKQLGSRVLLWHWLTGRGPLL